MKTKKKMMAGGAKPKAMYGTTTGMMKTGGMANANSKVEVKPKAKYGMSMKKGVAKKK